MSEQDTGTEKGLEAEVEKWKALSRKNEERAKENAEKAQRVDELETQYASVTARVAAAEAEAAAAAARAEAAEKTVADSKAESERSKLLAEVAEAKGLADPSVLVGSTREELEQWADKIKALIPEIPKAPGAGVQGDLGSDIAPKEDTPSPNDLIRAAAKS